MKLTYSIEQNTSQSTEVIFGKIKSVLKENDYEIKYDTKDSIEFNLEGWGSRIGQFSKVNSGKFEVAVFENHSVVRFQYVINMAYDFFLACMFFIGSFFFGGPAIYLLVIQVSVAIIRIPVAKSKSEEILSQIVS